MDIYAREYAVVDIETTGLDPERGDRIIEVAIVIYSPLKGEIDVFTSLLNPSRDCGPTSIHGLTDSDLESAPAFANLAGNIGEYLYGRIPVAHNARFDKRFIDFEYELLGYDTRRIPWLCTLKMASIAEIDCKPLSLPLLCDYLGILHPRTHTALNDARATAQLFARLIKYEQCVKYLEGLAKILKKSSFSSWPRFPATKQPSPRV
ncbi:MAG: 3'-5' exonuclease [Candidatus Dadabacteria bacterium]|nr:MAG: 3'-5' exonuclease [Candidatus Dadabacteria bacterium]